jgi:hypothetical protein
MIIVKPGEDIPKLVANNDNKYIAEKGQRYLQSKINNMIPLTSNVSGYVKF